MGVRGIAIATSISYFSAWLLTTIYHLFFIPKIKKAIMCPGREIWRRWSQYLKISLPTAVLTCASYWAFNILAVFAGIIGVSELAAQTIITTLSAIIIQVPVGLAEGVCAVSGNCIGAGNVALAKRFVSLIAKVAVGIILAISSLLYLLSDRIAGIFTHEEEVVILTGRVIQVVAGVYLLDSLQVYLCGPIRALGIQGNVANCALVGLWLFGIPLAILLGFTL